LNYSYVRRRTGCQPKILNHALQATTSNANVKRGLHLVDSATARNFSINVFATECRARFQNKTKSALTMSLYTARNDQGVFQRPAHLCNTGISPVEAAFRN